MKIPEFNPIQMTRTNPQHFGNSKITPITKHLAGTEPINAVEGIKGNTQGVSLQRTEKTGKSFEEYLLEAVNTVNTQQNDVTKLQEKLITSPDEVDIHDVTIAMSKARMSLNLAQTVIDRLVTGWNEITTTR